LGAVVVGAAPGGYFRGVELLNPAIYRAPYRDIIEDVLGAGGGVWSASNNVRNTNAAIWAPLILPFGQKSRRRNR